MQSTIVRPGTWNGIVECHCSSRSFGYTWKFSVCWRNCVVATSGGKMSRRPPAAAVLALVCLVCLPACSEKPNESVAERQPNGPLLIEPRVRVGSIRAGMSVQQALVELGPPQRKTAHAFEYTRLGFALLPDSNGMVKVVMCGDVTGINGPFVKAFTGRTKEGIGMRSTREDLLKAYGEPDENEKFRGGLESMKYQNLGIIFTLERGKVHHMIVRLGAPSETNRSVTLEPAPVQK